MEHGNWVDKTQPMHESSSTARALATYAQPSYTKVIFSKNDMKIIQRLIAKVKGLPFLAGHATMHGRERWEGFPREDHRFGQEKVS